MKIGHSDLKWYEFICDVKLTHYPKYDVNPLNSVGDIRQNHWTMIIGHWHRSVHACSAAAAVKGTCLLYDKYQLSNLMKA